MSTIEKNNVAVLSACQMFHVGIATLLSTHSMTLSWQSKDVKDAVHYLNAQPVQLLIVSLYIKQVNLLQILQFIQITRVLHPKIQLIVILDAAMPYLVTRLRRLGVGNILSLAQPLAEWQTLLHRLTHSDNSRPYPVYCVLQECRHGDLSVHERRVMNLLIQGFSIGEIAKLMMRSGKTIANHKVNAMLKLGINHFAQLIAMKSIFSDCGQPQEWTITYDRVCSKLSPRINYSTL